jgi:hypothetical protein
MSSSSNLPAKAKAKGKEAAVAPWSGDEHRLVSGAAAEAGLAKSEAELDSFTEGFKQGIVVDDPFDRAIVARGRTVLKEKELVKSLRPTMRFLGVGNDNLKVRVHDGEFELRIHKSAADASNPALDSAKLALQVWIGFGLLGLAAYNFIASFVAAIIWGVGLALGGWQLRRGLASGRAMLSARLAMALGMLAQEEQLILPPVKPPEIEA